MSPSHTFWSGVVDAIEHALDRPLLRLLLLIYSIFSGRRRSRELRYTFVDFGHLCVTTKRLVHSYYISYIMHAVCTINKLFHLSSVYIDQVSLPPMCISWRTFPTYMLPGVRFLLCIGWRAFPSVHWLAYVSYCVFFTAYIFNSTSAHCTFPTQS